MFPVLMFRARSDVMKPPRSIISCRPPSPGSPPCLQYLPPPIPHFFFFFFSCIRFFSADYFSWIFSNPPTVMPLFSRRRRCGTVFLSWEGFHQWYAFAVFRSGAIDKQALVYRITPCLHRTRSFPSFFCKMKNLFPKLVGFPSRISTFFS